MPCVNNNICSLWWCYRSYSQVGIVRLIFLFGARMCDYFRKSTHCYCTLRSIVLNVLATLRYCLCDRHTYNARYDLAMDRIIRQKWVVVLNAEALFCFRPFACRIINVTFQFTNRVLIKKRKLTTYFVCLITQRSQDLITRLFISWK